MRWVSGMGRGVESLESLRIGLDRSANQVQFAGDDDADTHSAGGNGERDKKRSE